MLVVFETEFLSCGQNALKSVFPPLNCLRLRNLWALEDGGVAFAGIHDVLLRVAVVGAHLVFLAKTRLSKLFERPSRLLRAVREQVEGVTGNATFDSGGSQHPVGVLVVVIEDSDEIAATHANFALTNWPKINEDFNVGADLINGVGVSSAVAFGFGPATVVAVGRLESLQCAIRLAQLVGMSVVAAGHRNGSGSGK